MRQSQIDVAPASAAGLGSTGQRLVFAAPLALFVVTLAHPFGAPLLEGREVAPFLRNRWPLWMIVHLALPFAAGAVAWALVHVVRPYRGRAAAVTRAALGVFVVAYTMFDSVVGLGTGLVARIAAQAPVADQPSLDAATDVFFGQRFGIPVGAVIILGAVAWAVAAISAALALRRAGASRWAWGLMIASGLVFAVDHSPPFGPAGMALLAGAFWALRARTFTVNLRHVPAPAGGPAAV
jgi:hypothetical protein